MRVIIFRVVACSLAFSSWWPWCLWRRRRGCVAARPGNTYGTESLVLTVAGSVDAIAAGVLLAVALRPHRTLLIAEHAGVGRPTMPDSEDPEVSNSAVNLSISILCQLPDRATRCVSWSSPAGPASAPSQRDSGISWKDVRSAICAGRLSCRGAEG